MQPAEWKAANPYATFGMPVAEAPADARVAFVRRTYMHLAGAVYAFALIEWLLLSYAPMDRIVPAMGQTGMLLVFGGFILVSWIADRWARSETSLAMQYTGLSLYVLAQAIFMAPLLWFASALSLNIEAIGEVGVIPAAGLTTLVMFAGLTAVAWFSGADFSFLRAGLMLGSFAAFALILAGCFIGLNLGVWFSALMVILACGYILYDTSNVMHHYRPSQHVAASLALFASVALLFWYVLRIFMALSSRD